MRKTVLDISYANPVVDFATVKASGISDIIIRTGYLNKTDTHFNSHMQGAIKNGFNIGVYTYIMSKTVAEAVIEAEQTISRIEKYKGHINYPVYCDMEDERYLTGGFGKTFDRRLCTDIITAFCDTIKKNGYYPVLYINPAWLEQYTYKSELLGKYDIWLAAWTRNDNTPTRYKYGQTMWQWGTSMINGIKGAVDTNVVYVDYPAVIKKSGLNFLLPPTPTIKTNTVNYIMKSLGSAAVRIEPRKSGTIIKRVEKSVYYLIDATVRNENNEIWLKHINKEQYSMNKDGKYLFVRSDTYSKKKVVPLELNVRKKPTVSATKMTVLRSGDTVYVFDNYSKKADGYDWVKILINGKVGYVAKQYLK